MFFSILLKYFNFLIYFLNIIKFIKFIFKNKIMLQTQYIIAAMYYDNITIKTILVKLLFKK
jgi:hypothetical protein